MPAPYNIVTRITVEGSNHSGVTKNVFHLGTNVIVWDQLDWRPGIQALITAIILCIRQTLLPALSNDWRLIKVTGAIIHPQVTDVVEDFGLATDVGAQAGSEVGFVSQLLSLQTGFGGKSKRGRMFLPPPPESGVTESRLTEGQIALIVAFVACMAGKFLLPNPSTDWRLVVFSRKLWAANANNVNAAVAEVQQIVVRSAVAALRSRKLGQGS